jgi:hypothetical protein
VVVISCTSAEIEDSINTEREVIETTNVELYYYLPDNGILSVKDSMTFFVDYQIKTTEPELDGFIARIMYGDGDEKVILRVKEIHERKGSFPYTQIFNGIHPSGKKFNYYVSICTNYSNYTKTIYTSDSLSFEVN